MNKQQVFQNHENDWHCCNCDYEFADIEAVSVHEIVDFDDDNYDGPYDGTEILCPGCQSPHLLGNYAKHFPWRIGDFCGIS